MTQRTRRPKKTRGSSRSGLGPDIPLNAQQEMSKAIMREAERSGKRSLEAAGKRIEQGIRTALKTGESVE